MRGEPFPRVDSSQTPSLPEPRRQHQYSRVSLSANEPVRVHLDGEFFCHPEDAVREIEVELVPKRLRVETFTV